MKFEDRIHQSARRLSAKQNADLRVPANPRKSNATYWGWVATPAAAIVGIALGLSFQHRIITSGTDETATNAITAQPVHDTVYVPEVKHDTMWLTRVEEKVRLVELQTPSNTPASTTSASAPTPHTSDDVCTSVSCDGINYAILASN